MEDWVKVLQVISFCFYFISSVLVKIIMCIACLERPKT